MRFDEVATVATTQETAWDQPVWVCERVPRVYLAVEWAAPSRTAEGTMEFVERLCLGTEDIIVPLNRR